MAETINILCTRPIDAALADKAKRSNILIDVMSFIDTHPRQDIETQQEIEWVSTEHAIVVFTSMNAVDAVTDMLDGYIPEWRIYCMGHATQQQVASYFGEHAIAGTADSAAHLAEEIIENEEPDEVIFFCGNRRRDELPSRLRKEKIEVTEIEVYETILLPRKVEKAYDGVLFFSPSAVESFFTDNNLPAAAVVFAIGETTAQAVKQYCSNKIIIAQQPGKDALLAQVTDYFHDF